MSLITYEDKVALNENPQVADVNKVTADDMNQIKNAINNLFPVGFIIEVDNAEFDPNVSWGGTWKRLKGRVIVGVDEDDSDFNISGKTGGEKDHILTISEIPQHNHKVLFSYKLGNSGNGSNQYAPYYVGNNYGGINTDVNGGGQAHNNMPPYYTAYQWIKTAM